MQQSCNGAAGLYKIKQGFRGGGHVGVPKVAQHLQHALLELVPLLQHIFHIPEDPRERSPQQVRSAPNTRAGRSGGLLQDRLYGGHGDFCCHREQLGKRLLQDEVVSPHLRWS